MAKICLNCGADWEDQQPISYGGCTFDPFGVVTYNGKEVRLNRQQRIIVGTILKGEGQFVHMEVLKNAVWGEETASLKRSNNIHVVLNKIRKKFMEVDPTFDRIDSDIRPGGWHSHGQQSRGYRWV